MWHTKRRQITWLNKKRRFHLLGGGGGGGGYMAQFDSMMIHFTNGD